jgi:hypothetical protein
LQFTSPCPVLPPEADIRLNFSHTEGTSWTLARGLCSPSRLLVQRLCSVWTTSMTLMGLVCNFCGQVAFRNTKRHPLGDGKNGSPFPFLIPENSENRFQKMPVKPAVVVRVKLVEHLGKQTSALKARIQQRKKFLGEIAMSALPPKADVCSAQAYVRFGPIADIARLQLPCGFCSCSMIWSTLKLDGFCRTGNSLKVATNCATSPCTGTTMNARLNI